MNRTLGLLLAGILMTGAAACSDNGTGIADPRTPASPAPVTGVWPDAVVMLVGDSARQLAAENFPASHLALPTTLTTGISWTSSNPSVASVDARGVVTPVAPGTATITARGGGGSAAAAVEVKRYSPALAFTQIDAGDHYACGRIADGRTFCWGGSTPFPNQVGIDLGTAGTRERCREFSQPTLANGFTYGPSYSTCSPVPLEVDGGHRFSQVSTARSHACGLDGAGAVWCWSTGQPRAVAGLPALRFIATGNNVDCGLDVDGKAWCWSTVLPSLGTPVAVAPALSFRTLAAGESGTCGIATDGETWCWSLESSPNQAPARLDTPLRFTALAVGSSFRCGLAADGQAYCWGATGTPSPTAGSVRLASMTAAGGGLCGVDAAGSAFCWGLGFDDWSTPRPAPVSGPLRELEGNWNELCGIRTDGSVYCSLAYGAQRRLPLGG